MIRSASLGEMHTAHLSGGEIQYWECGSGPPIVFVHGVLVNAELWRGVVPAVAAAGYRCLAPDWPLGAHGIPMHADADLGPEAVAALVGEFLDELGLRGVTLVGNDTGGAISQLLVARDPHRVERLVLTSCDCFDHFFPRIFKPLQWSARVPGAVTVLVQALRVRALHGLPLAFGRVAKRPLSPGAIDSYLSPSRRSAAIRRDLKKFLRGVDSRLTVEAADRLGRFTGPVLLAWSREDRVFPLALAERLASIFPNATLEPIDDAFTFSPEDQPERLAAVIVEFLSASTTSPASEPVRPSAGRQTSENRTEGPPA